MTERRFLPSLATAFLAVPLLLAAQIGRPEGSARGSSVVLDGLELPVPVAINPAGPVFALRPLAESLGGELGSDETGESSSLKLEGSEVVMGVGSAIITVGENIVSLSQPVTRGEAGLLVPLDFLRKTFGAVSGYAFDWRPEESRLVIARRESRELKVMLDVVHLQGMTTVVLQFPETPRYRLNQQPGSVEVQLLADRLAPPARSKKVEDALVQDVAFTPQQVRIQLVPGAEVESYLLENPFRLVFDVHRRSAAPVPIAPGAAAAELRGGTTRTIVLDPGHGGSETGAIGPGGVAEKELTLVLARDLETRLLQRLPVKVVLTRNDDTKLPLDSRTAVANQNKADLFVSLHLNSSLGSGAHGAETYFLSSQPTDTRAESAAAAENAGTAAPTTPGVGQENQDLQMILWDLAQTHHLAESQRFAGLVQAELNQALDLRDRGVKQAPFRVLMGAAMPAVLVELGFLSNPDEESKLQKPAYRADLVDALVRAIARYLEAPSRLKPEAPPLPPTQGAVPSNPGAPGPP
ncbi:MAG TPA: N-acetylmuramoyl-L-alanine amidase [Thermoanaerobaculia bacterium]|nr:N-acetylmuramoyl-L-alanine amidase [Thermoanaerobaculia bacterium]